MGLRAMPLPVEEPFNGEFLLPGWVMAGAVVGVVLGAGGQEAGGLFLRGRERDGVVRLKVKGLGRGSGAVGGGGGEVEWKRKTARG